MSGESDSRKDWHSPKLEQRTKIFVKLSFRQLCGSICFTSFNTMAIIHWVKNKLKQKGRLWVQEIPVLELTFMTLIWELSCHRKWHPGTSEISTPPEIVVGTHFQTQHGTKTIPVFLPADAEASWLLFSSSVSLLSGGTVQPENTYSCILKVTGQVWQIQKKG